jgi:hypothetical protein
MIDSTIVRALLVAMECCHGVQHYAATGSIPNALLFCRPLQSNLAI